MTFFILEMKPSKMPITIPPYFAIAIAPIRLSIYITIIMFNHCPFMAGRLGYLRLERFTDALADAAACTAFSVRSG